ncbi:iron export ABC transporter permease subunit FetB [Plantactinospora sp. ZYX-F-223]|uniref:ABC transporter permease n=1 Tax=Plantactinospora sp. ZYX-F-223 TaxID=3144103 RepID=UPI0031FC74C0
MTETMVPSWGAVAGSLVLVALVVVLAQREKLRLSRDLLVASLRAGVQLVAVGAVLLLVFAHTGLPGAVGWIALMVLLAGQVAGRRAAGVPRSRWYATTAIAAASGITLGALIALRAIPTQPHVLVPIGGMIVSGAMQAAGVTLHRLVGEAETGRPQIETRLSLGQPARQAFLPHLRSSVRTALLPAIDSTKVVGLISLPGAMTGLILAGVSPLTAIRYQIIVMYMLLAATTLAALIVARLAERGLFDRAHRLVTPPTPVPRRRHPLTTYLRAGTKRR